MLGEAFTWTCDMYVPPGESVNAVSFYRNQAVCAVIGHKDKKCLYQSENSNYIYRCQSDVHSDYTSTEHDDFRAGIDVDMPICGRL